MEPNKKDTFQGSFVKNCFTSSFEQATDEDILLELDAEQSRYENRELIDQGGMKKILSCYDRITDRDIARASLLSQEPGSSDFLREARITAKLEHPNIVPIYDIGAEDGQVFFIMKKLGGENLQNIIDCLALKDPKATKQFPLSVLLDIFLKVCDAVAFAHSKKILHLDIKPANIQVDEYGQVLVCDWGLARDANDEYIRSESSCVDNDFDLKLSRNDRVVGTPGYMAPEQIHRDFGSRGPCTDIFSIGALLYTILTFKRPVQGEGLEEILANTVNGKLVPPQERCDKINIPSALNLVVMKAMSHKGEERYISVSDLADDIKAYINGFATSAENASFTSQISLLLKRNKKISLVSAGAICVIFTISWFFIHQLVNEKNLALTAQRNEAKMRQYAESSQKLAKQAEVEALNLVEQLQNKEALVLQTRKTAARDLMRTSFFSAFKRREYTNAIRVLENILSLDPQLAQAQYYHGKMLMGELRFKEAYEVLSQYKGPRQTDWLLEGCLGFRNLEGEWLEPAWRPVFDFKKTLKNQTANELEGLRRHLTRSLCFQYSVEEHIEFARESLNDRAQGGVYRFEIKPKGGNYILSLRGNKCGPLDELQNLPLCELDLSYTDIQDLFVLRRMPLIKLNLAHTPVNDSKFLAALPLEELNLKGTKISSMKYIKTLPLRILRLNRYCIDLKSITQIKTLKTLILPRDIYDVDKLKRLAPHLEIIEE